MIRFEYVYLFYKVYTSSNSVRIYLVFIPRKFNLIIIVIASIVSYK